MRKDQREVGLILRRIGLRQRFKILHCAIRVARGETHLRKPHVARDVGLVDRVGALVELGSFGDISGRQKGFGRGSQHRRIIRRQGGMREPLLRRLRGVAVLAGRVGRADHAAAAIVEQQVRPLGKEVDDGEERVAGHAVEVANGRAPRHLPQQRRGALVLRADAQRRGAGHAQRRLARLAQLPLQLRHEDPDQQEQQRQGHRGDQAPQPSSNGPTAARHAR